jgi:hypothetical protein
MAHIQNVRSRDKTLPNTAWEIWSFNVAHTLTLPNATYSSRHKITFIFYLHKI